MFPVPWLRVSGKLTALEYYDKMIELNTIIPNAYSTMKKYEGTVLWHE